ncbi:MAG: sulfurtransferase TusA family protein [Syntrophomonadaceae bacterium]|nr:sulfurtransferase TusA family protein [Syntrophomonadaceae bacterium]
MVKIDVRGLSCPIPVVKVKKAMEENPNQPIEVMTDSQVSRENVSRLAENSGYTVKEEENGREFKLYLEPK